MVGLPSLVDLLLDDRLETHVDREPDIGSLLGQLLLAAVEHDFPAFAVTLDPAEALVPTEFRIEDLLDPVDPMAAPVGKS